MVRNDYYTQLLDRMNDNTLNRTNMTAEAQIERIADALKCVFGESSEGRAVRRKCDLALEEISSIHDHRGIKSKTIAVMGSKNTGKSWLCRQLVADEAGRAQIPCGEETNFATEKATWIGPEAPPVLMPDHELRIPLRREQMVDLGSEYTLLDLPGYDDASVAQRDAALGALRGAAFRVIVISSQTKKVESQFGYLQDSNGTRILPVIMDNQYPKLKTDGCEEVESLVEKIRRQCPDADVSNALVLPRIDRASGDENSNAALAKEHLRSALRDFIALPALDESVAGRIVFERLLRELSQDLHEFVWRVEPTHQTLTAKEEELAGQLIKQIVGEDAQLTAGLRMKLRFCTLAGMPQWFFPYRMFFGVFTVTAGAWDRLAFAMAGSLPSLATLAFQTARNAKRMGEMHDEARHALAERLQEMADDELAASNRIFVRSIRSALSLPADQADQTDEANAEHVPTRFKGLDRITRESSEIFQTAVEEHARTKGMPKFLGCLATLIFLALAAGPVWAVYREFVEAWSGAFDGEAAMKWQTFPAPSAGMIFVTLLLLILPVAVLALIGSLLSTPKKNVTSARNEIREKHDTLLKRLTQGGAVRLESDDPVREAVRTLLDACRVDGDYHKETEIASRQNPSSR